MAKEHRKKVDEFQVIVDASGVAIQATKEKAKMVEEHAVAKKAKVVAEVIETSLWAYDLDFKECKVLVK